MKRIGYAVVASVGLSLALGAPADAAALTITGPDRGSGTTPTFTGTGTSGHSISLAVDGAPACAVTVATDGTWRCPSTISIPASHAATVIAKDATSSESVSVVYHAAPAPSFIDPTPGSIIGYLPFDLVGRGASAGNTFAVTIDGVAAPQYTCEELSARPPYAWVCESPQYLDLPRGPHVVTVTATDAVGQSGTATANVVIDVPPTIPVVTSPRLGTPVGSAADLVVRGTGEAGVTIQVMRQESGPLLGPDGTPLKSVVGTDGTWALTVPAAVLASSFPVVTSVPIAGSREGWTFVAGSAYGLQSQSALYGLTGFNLDIDGDRRADVAARSSRGDLLVYYGDSAGRLRNGLMEGAGWNAAIAMVSPGDFDHDGMADVIAQMSNGELRLYGSHTGQGFTSVRTIGSGWNSITALMSPGDFDGDGNADLLARVSTGDLRLYEGDGAGGWKGVRTIGTGWNGISAMVSRGDFDGDGQPDVVARVSSGELRLYQGDGRGGWKGVRTIGSGWNPITALIAPGDFDGDGHPDLLARVPGGDLRLYRGDGRGGWRGVSVVGTGWDSLTAFVQ